jgi:excisionase family DNA binding protein
MESVYLSKAVAAKRLGLSVRRLMEISAAGKLKRYKGEDPATRRESVMFDAGEVARLKDAWTPKAVVPAALPRPARSTALVSYPNDKGRALDSSGQNGPRPWLDLAQASEYSGLPEKAIRDLIRRGKLRALDVGVRPGGRYRIARRDLDAIEGDLFDLPWASD